jgi:hypothetical protein
MESNIGISHWSTLKSPVKFIKERSKNNFGPSPPETADFIDAATTASAKPGCYHATLFCSVKIVVTYTTPTASMSKTLPEPTSHHFTFTLKAARITGKAPDRKISYSSALDA